MEGVFAINKPKGCSSTDLVSFVKKTLLLQMNNESTENFDISSELIEIWNKKKDQNVKKKRINRSAVDIKCGHGGTLDPLASGIMVIAVGSGTKDLGGFQSGNFCRKTYVVTAQLGMSTDSFDVLGKCTGTNMDKTREITQIQIEEILRNQFNGDILQRPPVVDGKRYYDLARATQETHGDASSLPPPPPRAVTIHSIKLVEFSKEPQTHYFDEKVPKDDSLKSGMELGPVVKIRIECGGGTYIRSIVHDLGEILGCGAYMLDLVRTQQGPFINESELPKVIEIPYNYIESKAECGSVVEKNIVEVCVDNNTNLETSNEPLIESSNSLMNSKENPNESYKTKAIELSELISSNKVNDYFKSKEYENVVIPYLVELRKNTELIKENDRKRGNSNKSKSAEKKAKK